MCDRRYARGGQEQDTGSQGLLGCSGSLSWNASDATTVAPLDASARGGVQTVDEICAIDAQGAFETLVRTRRSARASAPIAATDASTQTLSSLGPDPLDARWMAWDTNSLWLARILLVSFTRRRACFGLGGPPRARCRKRPQDRKNVVLALASEAFW